VALLFILSLLSVEDSVIVIESSMGWNIDACQRCVSVARPELFAPGHHVLLHAAVCRNGHDARHHEAGTWSWNRIDTVADGRLWLRFPIPEPLAHHPGIQVIRAHEPPDGVIDRRIGVRPWDGASGGVIAIWSDEDIDLHSPISSSGAGFAARPSAWNERDTVDAIDVDAMTPIHRGSGQGACAFLQDSQVAHPWFLGGCGGRARNSGGSGGNGAGGGGRGGLTSSAFTVARHAPPGVARPLPEAERLVFGTAGGCGHGNDLDAGMGGAGGGIIAMRCRRIRMAPGSIISADGINGKDASHDGAGGGGAGGMISIDAESIEGHVSISARGGHGGSTSSTLFVCGPGGGGSGGTIMLTAATDVTSRLDVHPGAAGAGRVSATPTYSTNHGASDGDSGRVLATSTRWSAEARRSAHPRLICDDTVVDKGASAIIRAIGDADVTWLDAVTAIDKTSWRTPAIHSGRWFRTRLSMADGCVSIDSVHVRPRPTTQSLTITIGDMRANAGDSIDVYLSVRASSAVGRTIEGTAFVSTHPRVLLPAGASGRVHDGRTRLTLPFRLTTGGTSTYRRDRLIAVLGDSATVQLSIDSVTLSSASNSIAVRRQHGSFTLEDLCTSGGRQRLIGTQAVLIIRGRSVITNAPDAFVCDVLGRILTQCRNPTQAERTFEIASDVRGLVFVVVGGDGWLRSVPVWLSP